MALDKIGIAKRIDQELKDGWYVNLGIGIPTLVANFIPDGIEVEFQSENGLLGMGPFPVEGTEDADLITPSFSCTGESIVMLNFENIFAQYALGEGKVDISINNGAWSNVYTVGAALAQNAINGNPDVQDIDISALAANQANVRLRFKYTGDWDYWWVVDDINVYAPTPYDAAISGVSVSEYSAIPLDQVTSYTPSCEVSNNGGLNVTGISVATNIYDGASVSVFNSFEGILNDLIIKIYN